MADISLVSINIERAKHYDRLFPFLLAIKADIICFQELYERDVSRFERELGGTMVYEPAGLHPTDPPEHGFAMEGVGILSRLPIVAHDVHYYAGTETATRNDIPDRKPHNHPILFVSVLHGEEEFHIGTTHFTWTPDGRPNEEQRRNAARLLDILERERPFVVTGDFNAPRGGEIFSLLSRSYTDNIPPEYAWSLDLKLHRAGNGGLQASASSQGMQGLMVDGLFSTREYDVSNVRLQDGVSDHMAIVARIRCNR
jgi:endonuclease/exonuclease/phosphatase family metal-dependent hydrolase